MNFNHFKIIICLEHFFRDHRSKARIFINERISSIKDLCDHISKIFNIHNFYLITSENHYLPPSEDIAVLHPNETIWVRPSHFVEWEQKSLLHENDRNNGNENNIDVVPLKRKRKKVNIVTDLHEETDKLPKQKKKKRKKLDYEIEQNSSNIDELTTNLTDVSGTVISSNQKIGNDIIKEKKKKKRLVDTEDVNAEQESKINCTYNNCAKTPHISSNGKIGCVNKSIQQTTVKMHDSIIESKTKKANNFLQDEQKNQNEVAKIEEHNNLPKSKVNIIENKVISIGTNHMFSQNLVDNVDFAIKSTSTPILNNLNTDSENTAKTTPCNASSIRNENIYKNKESLNVENCYNLDCKSNTYVLPKLKSSLVSKDEDSQSIINLDDETAVSNKNSSFETLSKSIRPSLLNMSVGPFINLLNESEQSVIDDSFVTKRKRKRYRKRKTVSNTNNHNGFDCTPIVEYKPPVEQVHRPLVHIRFEENVGDETCTTEKAITGHRCSDVITNGDDECKSGPDNIDLQNIDAITEEHIEKCPKIKDCLLQIGNTISFKILHISETYTPEISTFIIARVLNCDKDRKEVTFEVIKGIDQLAQPEGKFFLEQQTYDDEKSEKNTDHFTFKWTDLIDTRLLLNN